ncbi:MAG: CDP-diacylglycerol--glycerol-3-phosphate 3-phosphatidyltransferase [Elusimicrobia bacterium]|nr:CDP-diacylglycerol--glycerol-3-phosphate 3-phosphatidyltransferase [Candidatus Obscuribacterium magneticum]
MKINFPTRLTLLRLLSIPFFLVFTIKDNALTRIVALLIFIGASITDVYDGRVARRRNLVTTLGTFLDPLVDKLLISTAFIAFVQIEEIYIPAWMVILIIGREFLITGLRTLAVSRGRILSAQPAGKFKTTSQVTAIITILIILTANSLLEDFGGFPKGSLVQHEGVWQFFGWVLRGGPYWLTFVTTLLTIVSGYIYLKDNADLFNEEPAKR